MAKAFMRERIAHAAARLMAEDGITDYGHAKRKAARQLGAPESQSLPGNSEIEAALRSYQGLYQREEQADRLLRLRRQARQMMDLFHPFNPHLTGSVLVGTASRHSDTNLLLFADSPKEVEFFLLRHQIAYETREKRLRLGDSWLSVPVYLLQGEENQIELAVLATDDVRKSLRSPVDGGPLERARANQLDEILLHQTVGTLS